MEKRQDFLKERKYGTGKLALACMLLLGSAAIGSFAVAAPQAAVPADAAARATTPEQKAIIAASAKEQVREMQVLGDHRSEPATPEGHESPTEKVAQTGKAASPPQPPHVDPPEVDPAMIGMPF